MSGIGLGTFNEVKKLSNRPPAYDMATHAATGFCKPSIILFDIRSGTRSFTIPQGVKRIRAFVVGAGGNEAGSGGGYSEKEYFVSGGDSFNYTVGASPGGTSSFNSEITATGGGDDGGAAGAGSGGDVSSSGGVSTGDGGASSGHRYGNGFGSSGTERGGAGWGESPYGNTGGSSGGIDGFGLGMVPTGRDGAYNSDSSNTIGAISYGSGATRSSSSYIGGGGGGYTGAGGIGGGGGISGGNGGFGLVGIEVLETE